MARKRVSIKDIAAAAGVSHPTVSRALRGQGRMSEETRARILSLAQEMGYTPNLVARGLVTQRTNSIGLVVTYIEDPFHSEIIRGVERIVQENGYSLFLASTTADPEQELQVVRSFQGRNVDGIIVSASLVGDRYADILEELGIPIVLINCHAEGSNLYAVMHDDYAGAQQVVQHLIDTGNRRIAYMGHRKAGRVHEERKRAWFDALQKAGLDSSVTIDAPERDINHGFSSVAALLSVANQHWGQPPDALFCFNDLLAIGAMSGLRHRGLRVPDDIVVAGFDDLDVSAHLQPSLTTLRQPRYEMGVRAVEILLQLISKPSELATHDKEIRFRGQLQVRESTRRYPAGRITLSSASDAGADRIQEEA